MHQLNFCQFNNITALFKLILKKTTFQRLCEQKQGMVLQSSLVRIFITTGK